MPKGGSWRFASGSLVGGGVAGAFGLRGQSAVLASLTQSNTAASLRLQATQGALQEIQSAAEGLQLAEQELEQAERRYRAGITNNLEVTDAQARLERARDNHIEALFNYNLQRINLGEAMGIIRSML